MCGDNFSRAPRSSRSSQELVHHALCRLQAHTSLGPHRVSDGYTLVFSTSAEGRGAALHLYSCPLWQGCHLLGGPSALFPPSAVALSSRTPVRLATRFHRNRRRGDPLSPCKASSRGIGSDSQSQSKARRSQNTLVCCRAPLLISPSPRDPFLTSTTHVRWRFSLVGQENPAVAAKRRTLGQEKTTKNGNCRLACASLLNGVEGFKFFNIRQRLGVRFPRFVEDLPRCCNPSGVSPKCANAMRQRFGDSQTRASECAETTAESCFGARGLR